jgi:dolichyl-phosphate-mannose-protein mannosyltransferase
MIRSAPNVTAPPPSRRDWGLSAVLLLVVCGVALALQGWRGRIPTIDLVPHYLDAVAFVRDGAIPTRGTISGYLAYNPPGPTWLMVPGAFLTDDPRLIEFFVSALLYAATMLGIYSLARTAFGRATAILATSLYAFSEIGLFVAGTLWPRAPIQPFVVWMVYWLQRWAVRQEAGGLPMALGIWAAGMYVFMEIAPAILLVPFFWYRYRPPVRLTQVAVAIVAGLALWWPYLVYEAQHDYRDLQSMVLRAEVDDSAPRGQQWCDRQLTLIGADGQPVAAADRTPGAPESGGVLRRAALAGYRGLVRVRGAIDNAITGAVGGTLPHAPGADVVLFGAAALSLIGVALGSTALGPFVLSRPIRHWTLGVVIGAAFVGMGVVAPYLLVPVLSADGSIERATRDALDTLRMLSVGAGVLLIVVRPLWMGLARVTATLHGTSASSSTQRFLLFAVVVPWAALLVLVEPERSERFWWLWPLVAIFLAALVFHSVGTETVRRRLVAAVVVVILMAATWVTPTNIARLESWRTAGWAGHDADEIRAVEYVAARAGGRRDVRLGYQVPFFRGIPGLSAVDSRFKVGAELDLMLAYKHGIANMSRCAEGVSPSDDYRLVDVTGHAPPGTYRFVALPGAGFRPVRRFGTTEVFERSAPY